MAETQPAVRWVDIPGLPPPLNNLYPTNWRTGRRVLSAEGRAWHQTVADACVAWRVLPFPHKRVRLSAVLEFAGLDYRSDIDGRAKATLDALARALGFDDRWIEKLVLERVRGSVKETRVRLTVLEEEEGMTKVEGIIHRVKRDPRERFMNKVTVQENGCWLWIGAKASNGYGIFQLDATERMAHRASYRLVHGDIPEGMFVLHRCDVPACVNPEHLFLGTAKENSQDMVRKGRAATGERNPMRRRDLRLARTGDLHHNHKLSDAQVREVRRRTSRGETQSGLARELGVSISLINNIVLGKARTAAT